MDAQQSVERDGDSLRELVERALEYLRGCGYTELTVMQYHRFWKRFIRFADRHEEVPTFTELVERYLDACGRVNDTECTSIHSQNRIRTVMRVLREFAVHGCIQTRRPVIPKPSLSAGHEALFGEYMVFCRDHVGNSPGTLKILDRDIRHFMRYLDNQGINNIEDVEPSMLSTYLMSRVHLKTTSLQVVLGSLRSLARFLLIRGHVDEAFVRQLKTIRFKRPQPIPSVWTREEVDALLAAVDRGSPTGKRDYVILLLAAELGMRGGDIRSLRLEHLYWDEARIEFTQSKTGNRQTLPMSETLGAALADYLRNARPRSEHREVFLRACAPFDPLNEDNRFYHIITKYRQRAGVPLRSQPRKAGLHALRHSLASRLIEEGTSFETLAGVLGHRQLESTHTYVRVDVEALRGVALDPEEVGK